MPLQLPALHCPASHIIMSLTALCTFLSKHKHTQLNIVSIPPAVLSMLAVPLLLTALGSATADKVMRLFDSAVAPWTTDLLGLYFVPAVAVLPVLLRGMQGGSRLVQRVREQRRCHAGNLACIQYVLQQCYAAVQAALLLLCSAEQGLFLPVPCCHVL